MSRHYFEATPPNTCPDPEATPVRAVSDFTPCVDDMGRSRRFCYLTQAQAEESLTTLQATLSEKDPARYYPGLAESVGRAYRLTIDAIRDAAKAKGYAIGVHGSLARDIDLIACPWTDGAAPAAEMAEAVRAAAASAIPGGNCWSKTDDPKQKPHGRLSWSLHFAAGGYIDLSVMPRAATEGPSPVSEPAT